MGQGFLTPTTPAPPRTLSNAQRVSISALRTIAPGRVSEPFRLYETVPPDARVPVVVNVKLPASRGPTDASFLIDPGGCVAQVFPSS